MREKRKSVEKARAQREGFEFVDPDNPPMKLERGLFFTKSVPVEPDPRQRSIDSIDEE